VKILQIITHLEIGGAQKATLLLSKELKSRGHEVILISSAGGGLTDEFKKILGSDFKALPYLRRAINPIFDLLAFFSIYIYIKDSGFDLVHTHSSKAGILGRWAAYLASVKSVHTVHGFAFHDYQNIFLRCLYILVERVTAIISDKIIFVSEGVWNKALNNSIVTDKSQSKFRIIYELIKIENLKPIAARTRLKKDFFIIGMVAPLKEQKRPEDFLRFARILIKKRDDVRFILVGDGRLRPRLEKKAENWKISERVEFKGWRDDAYSIMSSFDIFVLSSIFEGQPHVILEAMSLAIPLIATSVDGVRELVSAAENGFLVQPFKPDDIACLANRLLDDRVLRESLGAKGYNYFKNNQKFNYIKNIDKIENIYKSIAYE
jgi:glycosyltransferase involved in cell wall biosynthesis